MSRVALSKVNALQHSLLRTAVHAILKEALHFEWTAQGLGMLRTYLPGLDNVRLHIWNSALEFPHVSKIHTHPWDLESYVLAGVMHNVRYTESEGQPYCKQMLRCGVGGCSLGEPIPVRLHSRPCEVYREGASYYQKADELHLSVPDNGSVTLVRRTIPEGRSADLAYVYWPEGEAWVSAEPRPASAEEIVTTTKLTLQSWF